MLLIYYVLIILFNIVYNQMKTANTKCINSNRNKLEMAQLYCTTDDAFQQASDVRHGKQAAATGD